MEEREEEDVVCEVCGVEGLADVLVLCDGCGGTGARHIYCMEPPKESVPQGKWYCPFCREKRRKDLSRLSQEDAGNKERGQGELSISLPSTSRSAAPFTLSKLPSGPGLAETSNKCDASGMESMKNPTKRRRYNEYDAQLLNAEPSTPRDEGGQWIPRAGSCQEKPFQTQKGSISVASDRKGKPIIVAGEHGTIEENQSAAKFPGRQGGKDGRLPLDLILETASQRRQIPDDSINNIPANKIDHMAQIKAVLDQTENATKALNYHEEVSNPLPFSGQWKDLSEEPAGIGGKLVPLMIESQFQKSLSVRQILWRGAVVVDGSFSCKDLIARPVEDAAILNPTGCRRAAELLTEILHVKLVHQKYVISSGVTQHFLQSWAALQITPEPGRQDNTAFRDLYRSMKVKAEIGSFDLPDDRREVILWPGRNERHEQVFWVLIRPSSAWIEARYNFPKNQRREYRSMKKSRPEGILLKTNTGIESLEGIKICLLGFPADELRWHLKILSVARAKLIASPEVNKVDMICIHESFGKHLETLPQFSAQLFLDWKIRFLSGASSLTKWCKERSTPAYDVSKHEHFAKGIIIVYDYGASIESALRLALLASKLKSLASLEGNSKGVTGPGSTWKVKIPAAVFAEIHKLLVEDCAKITIPEDKRAVELLFEEWKQPLHISCISEDETSQSSEGHIPQIVRTSVKIASFSRLHTRLVVLMTSNTQTLAAGCRQRTILSGDYGYALGVLQDCMNHFQTECKAEVPKKKKINKVRFCKGF